MTSQALLQFYNLLTRSLNPHTPLEMQFFIDSFRQTTESPEFHYTLLVFCLFVFPQFLVRFRIPMALSAFLLGFLSQYGNFDFGVDPAVKLLASIGIVSLFLFAGLEVEISKLRDSAAILIQHSVIKVILLGCVTFISIKVFDLDFRPAALIGLALLTPSTGFILDSLNACSFTDVTKDWIRSKAIATEVIALFFMFVLVRSGSASQLLLSTGALVILIIALPLVFRFFSRHVVKFAPQSEFGFLLMTALVAGLITKKLGAYYLVGAFIVGIVARHFDESLPKLTSRRMLNLVKFFASIFTPFYFFRTGSNLPSDYFSWSALMLATLLIALVVPARIYSVVLHRRLSMGEKHSESFPIAVSLLPNLVFGLVILDLVGNEFKVSHQIISTLIIYTLGVTLIPPLLLRLFWKSPSCSTLSESHVFFSFDDREVDKNIP